MKYGIKIDGEKLKNALKKRGLTAKEVSESIGKNSNYITGCVCTGAISDAAMQLIEIKYQIPREEIKIIEKENLSNASPGFSLNLVVKPDRVRVSINHNGKEIYGAYARINGDTETRLIQAISYAAHMCYKQAEQRELGDKS